MKHGTHTAYHHGCRCVDCREFESAYARKLRGQTVSYGPTVVIDRERVRELLDRKGTSIYAIEQRLGITTKLLAQVMVRGRCGLYTADTFAVALGVTYHEIVTDDLVSVAS